MLSQHFLNQQDGEQASKLPSGQDHPGERGGLLDGCNQFLQRRMQVAYTLG
jgi:hypothetical protein